MKKKHICLLTLVSTFFMAYPLHAQMFNQPQPDLNSAENTQSQPQSQINDEAQSQQDLNMTSDEEKEVMERLRKQLNPRVENGNLVINPVDLGATGDGSKRGGMAFISTEAEEGEDEGNIFLYYSNFQINRTATVGLGCRVRFHILNGLNNRISNVSVKLVWPGVNTPISFSNINPNTENYFDYALFGEGCYQMDKLPNIVVNRCRVKGMSQEACANKIRWLSKQ